MIRNFCPGLAMRPTARPVSSGFRSHFGSEHVVGFECSVQASLVDTFDSGIVRLLLLIQVHAADGQWWVEMLGFLSV